MRRRATVTSTLPDTASAAASASSERNPPVPSSRRERSSVPAMVNTSVLVSVTAISASLDRAQDLHPRPLVQMRRVPLAARDDLGVDRDRHATPGARQVERLQRGLDGRAVHELGGLAVEQDLHASTPSKRRGSAAAANS